MSDDTRGLIVALVISATIILGGLWFILRG
jgi:hypothetical protein